MVDRDTARALAAVFAGGLVGSALRAGIGFNMTQDGRNPEPSSGQEQVLGFFDAILVAIEGQYRGTAPALLPLQMQDIPIEEEVGFEPGIGKEERAVELFDADAVVLPRQECRESIVVEHVVGDSPVTDSNFFSAESIPGIARSAARASQAMSS